MAILNSLLSGSKIRYLSSSLALLSVICGGGGLGNIGLSSRNGREVGLGDGFGGGGVGGFSSRSE